MDTNIGTRSITRTSRLRLLAVLAALVLGLVFTTSALATISVGSIATSQNTRAGDINLTIRKPDGTSPGDFLLAQVSFHTGSAAVISPPAGWTLVLRNDNGTEIGQALYRKIAGAAEPATYTWTFNSGQTRATGGIARYKGVDQTNPLGDSTGNTGEGTSLTALSVEAEAESRVVAHFSIKEVTTLTNPSGMTFRFLQEQPKTGDLSIRATDQPRDAGATGDKVSTASAADSWVAQQVVMRVDTTSPSVEISSTAADPTSVSPIPVVVQFSEAVTGFEASDIVITNGTLSNFVALDGDTYTFDLTPTANDIVTANIAADVAEDETGNSNTAAPQFSRAFDSNAPSVSISSTALNPTNVSPIPVIVQFSEAVTGFEASDIVITNGTLSNFVALDGDTYTFDLTPAAGGEVTVNIAAGVAQDAQSDANTAAPVFSRIFDNEMPSVLISSTASDPTSELPIPMVVQFSEPVIGFEASDIVITNGTLSGFDIADDDTYTFDLTPSGNGQVVVNIAAGVAQDETGNLNMAAPEFTRMFEADIEAPSVSLSSTAPDPANVSPIPVVVQFSEFVNGFVAGDISATNGVISNFVTVDSDTYTFDLKPTAAGAVTVNIAAGVAQDTAGNPNTAAPEFTRMFTVDAEAPTVTINQAVGQDDPTSDGTVHFTVVFNEPVTDLTSSDINLGGTAGAIIAVVTESAPNNGTTFDVAVSGMTTSGTIVVSIPPGVAINAAGKGNEASTSTDNTIIFTLDGIDSTLVLPFVSR